MIDKNTIYSYFQTDDFPTEEQFRATWDSFWHKSESIPMSSITGLNQLFQQTATVAQLNGKANVDGSNINVSAYQEKLNITNLIATAKEEVKTELLNGAPEAFDTLKEISDWISDDETAEAAILQAIQNEATARTNADNLKLDKPTITSNPAFYPYVVGENGNGGSARLPAGDLGKNFFNADLSNTTARNHTMNAAVTVNTLGNPHTLSGLPNKNADITNFRKVRVQNTSGLDSVVDSNKLLTDGLTSMTDAEKDAWRLAQRKTNENYSTTAPRIDYILPFVVKREDAIQYIMLQGINLYVNPVTAIVRIVNTSTLQEYDVLTNSITVYANDFNRLQFSFNFSTIPVGTYKIKLINNSVQNIDNTTFDVVDSTNSISIDCSWDTVQSSNSVFTVHNAPITTSNGIYQKCATVNANSELTVASVSKSSTILTQNQVNGDWIITLDITHNKNSSYWGGWSVGLMKSNNALSLLNNVEYGYGRSMSRYLLVPLSGVYSDIDPINILVEKLILIKTGLKIALFWVNGSTFTLIGVTTLLENINSDVSLVLKTYGANTQYGNDYYPNSDVQVQISSIVLK